MVLEIFFFFQAEDGIRDLTVTGVQTCALPILTPVEMLARVDFDGDDRVRTAHAHGRGVLLFTGHFGFWEINALVHALMLNPIAVLARPLDNPLLHDLLERVRTTTGNTVIYRRGAIRRVLRALGANQACALLIGQDPPTAAARERDCFERPRRTTPR